MGGGRGCYAGVPLTLRCAKCKVGRDYTRPTQQHVGTYLEATGELRLLTSAQFGIGHPRTLGFRAGYRCRDCGHVGWSRHRRMLFLLREVGYEVPTFKQVEDGLRLAERA